MDAFICLLLACSENSIGIEEVARHAVRWLTMALLQCEEEGMLRSPVTIRPASEQWHCRSFQRHESVNSAGNECGKWFKPARDRDRASREDCAMDESESVVSQLAT